MISELGRAALAYARLFGWRVHPLGARAKEPLTAGGFLGATTDATQIRRWWRRWPDANIGLACDERSKIVGVDIDPRNGGEWTIEELEDQFGSLPATVEALTGGGGRHLLYRRPTTVQLRPTLGRGVDLKSNGYLVAPPSVHPNGRPYLWEASSRPEELELAPLPDWIVALAGRRSVVCAAPDVHGDVARCFLARAFAEAGWLGRRLDPARHAARCPWQAEHTRGMRGAESSTVIFAARGEQWLGWFHCSHTSHGRKSMRDVLCAIPEHALERALAAIVREAGLVDTIASEATR